MARWLGILFGTLRSCVRTHRELALENLALRQQLAVWKARQPRPRLTDMDRIFWVFLSRLWTSWRHSLQVVRPETVVGWHRQGFRRYWSWKSRRPMGSARDWEGPARSDSTDESRESALGCAEDPRRAVEARPDGLAGDGFAVHAPASAAAVAGMARISDEPCPGSDRVGFLHGADSDLSSALCADRAEPRPVPAGAFQCHRAPDGGMDGAPTARGVRAGREPSASDPGPGSGLWRTIFASSAAVGHPGGGHCATLAMAKRLRGAGDWLAAAGMP